MRITSYCHSRGSPLQQGLFLSPLQHPGSGRSVISPGPWSGLNAGPPNRMSMFTTVWGLTAGGPGGGGQRGKNWGNCNRVTIQFFFYKKDTPVSKFLEPVSVTLFRKRVSEGVIKNLEMRSPWITQMDTKSNAKCPYKRQKRRGQRREPCEGRGGA